MGSEQEQKTAHQENYSIWVNREKWIPELTEISGQLHILDSLFIFNSQVKFLAHRIHLVNRGLVSYLESRYFSAAWSVKMVTGDPTM